MRNRRFLVATVSIAVLCSCETGVPVGEVAGLYYNLGNAYFELDKLDKAVTAYLNALELDNSLPQAGYNLARVYIESGRVEEGIDALNDLLEDDPENSLILSTIGWAYYLLDEHETSLEIFIRVLERTPTDVNSLYNAAVLAWLLDKNDLALEMYERLYSETGEYETLYKISSIYIELEMWPEAIDVLTQYVEYVKDDSDAYYDLGIAYTADRLYGEALTSFESAIELDPDDPILYFEKAAILLLYIENLDEGIKMLEIAVEKGFDDTVRAAALRDAEGLLFGSEVEEFLLQSGLVSPEPTADEVGEEADEPETELPADEEVGSDSQTDGEEESEAGVESEAEEESVVEEEDESAIDQPAIEDQVPGVPGPKTELPQEESESPSKKQ